MSFTTFHGSLFPLRPLQLAMTSTFRLPGSGLKLESAADIKPYLDKLPSDVESVHFGGHSLGVGACEAIAKALRDSKTLKVCSLSLQSYSS